MRSRRGRVAMESVPVSAKPARIRGQLLRLSAHHAVAIYLRDGAMGIAEFIDGHGDLVDVNSWFRFNCGSPANAYLNRRMAIESAIPLSAEVIAQIEALHCPPEHSSRPFRRMLNRLTALLMRGHLVAQSMRPIRHPSFRKAPPAP
jgi:hypothetical protein